MSHAPVEDGRDGDDGDGRPDVPEGVLEGIADVAEGNTADKDDIESALDF